MSTPDDRRYAPTHEWHKLEGDTVTLGISQFAVDELTDITYVEVDADQGKVGKGEAIGEIESVKATSELYSGVAGEIVEVNQAVVDDPSLINQDPYGQGWIARIKLDNPAQLEELLSAADYAKQHGE